VSREPYSTPVFTKNFYRLIEDLESRLPRGVHPAGNLLTYPKSRNVNNVIGSGRRAAEEVTKEYRGRN
jgi:protoporphyrinogen oxidase